MRRTSAKTKPKTAAAVVRPSPLDKRKAMLRFGPLTFRAALGRSGVTSFKREGDGATPRGVMPILSGYRRGERHPAIPSPLSLKRITSAMLWCDAPAHPAYNRPVTAPFAGSHERLLREDRLYDICLVLDWNIRQRRRGAGSAIFFHLARPGYAPTEGCVAVSPRDMLRLMPHLRRGTKLVVL